MHVAIVVVTCVLIASVLLTAAATSTRIVVLTHPDDRVAAWSKWMDTLAWWARFDAVLAVALLILLIIGWSTHTE